MTQKLHGLIGYIANKFGHVADHFIPAVLVNRSPFLTSEDSAEHIDPKVFLQGLLETLDESANAAIPTNHRTHHFWREMTLVTTQQG